MLLCVMCHSYCHTVADVISPPTSGGTTGTLLPGTHPGAIFGPLTL